MWWLVFAAAVVTFLLSSIGLTDSKVSKLEKRVEELERSQEDQVD